MPFDLSSRRLPKIELPVHLNGNRCDWSGTRDQSVSILVVGHGHGYGIASANLCK